jgi:chromodomain-helicase-DNA-binding protein 1
MNSTSPLPLSNGHDAALARSSPSNDDAPGESESELSDVANPPVDEASPSSSNRPSDFGGRDTDASDASGDEAQDQEDDGDFDMDDTPAATALNGERTERSSSVESRRPAKRKAGIEQDRYFLENPELYGLRRSVCLPLLYCYYYHLLT